MIENLRSLAILAAVVENGSFRAAGEKLGLSSSVVSHHISKLEKRLDCAIFLRTSRQLQLTEKGAILHSSARQMVDAIQSGLNAISGKPEGVSGTLRVGMPQSMASSQLVLAVNGFLSQFPKVNLDIVMTSKIEDAQDGGCDVLITRHQNHDTSYTSTRITDFPMRAVAAPDLSEKINKIPLQDVPATIPLVLSQGFTIADWQAAFSIALGEQISLTTARTHCDSLSFAHKLACIGAGVLVLPLHQVQPDLTSGRLVEVLPELALSRRVLYAICPQTKEDDTLARHFIDYIAADYANGSHWDDLRKAG